MGRAACMLRYARCPRALQLRVADRLLAEWGPDFRAQGAGTPDAVRRLLLRSYAGCEDELYVFGSEGRLLGTVATDTKNLAMHIGQLYVVPERRGQGWGGRLLAWAQRRVAEHGMAVAYLWCDAGLRPFYERRGWRADGETRVSETRTVTTMVKQLV